MKTLGLAALLILVPAIISASPLLGLYFEVEPFNTHHCVYDIPSFFDVYLYGRQVECYLTAVEFMMTIGSPSIGYQGFDIPEGSVNLGDPLAGMSITYWPPLDGWVPGYNWLATFHLVAFDRCLEKCMGLGGGGGGLVNVELAIVAHPETGEIRGTCWPTNEIFLFLGQKAYICPTGTGSQEESWGAIKTMLE